MADTDRWLQVPPDSNGNKIQMYPWLDGAENIQTPVNQIADRNDPTKRLGIASDGAATIAFTSGIPQYTATNRQASSIERLMGMFRLYLPEYFSNPETDDFTDEFHTEVANGGAVTYDAAERGVKLNIGVGIGAKAAFHSHRHFIYRLGNSKPLFMTFKASDAGKVGVRRRFGWFSNEGNTRLILETFENNVEFIIEDDDLGYSQRAIQDDWNGDDLSGNGGDANLSEELLDTTKLTIWWLDYQYPAGALRFGQMINGKKVVCHTMGNYNVLDRPWCSDPSFSFGMEIENTAVSPSSSYIIAHGGLITNDGYQEFDEEDTIIRAEKTLDSNNWTPIVTIRPSELKGGVTNRSRVLPTTLDVFSTAAPIEIVSEINSSLQSALAEPWGGKKLDIDYDIIGTWQQGTTGREKSGHFSGTGETNEEELEPSFPKQLAGITRHYDATETDTITFFAKKLIEDDVDTLVKLTLHVAELE